VAGAIAKHRRLIAWIPVFEVTGFSGAVDVAAGLEQFVAVARLHNLEHFEQLVTQLVDVRVPR
jgi:hypothetical protein